MLSSWQTNSLIGMLQVTPTDKPIKLFMAEFAFGKQLEGMKNIVL